MVTPSPSNLPLRLRGPLGGQLAAGLLVLLLVGLIGMLDYLTGTEARLYPLYFIPIGLAAWTMRPAGALVASATSGAAWAASNALAGVRLSPHIWAINSLAQLTAFFTVSVLILLLRGRIEAEARLARLDRLTGLANSRSFFEAAGAEITRQRRHHQPLSLAYIDLDDFKAINDSLGHRTGDELLSEVAAALRAETRRMDCVARMGGDEFAVLFPETSAAMVEPLLARVQQAVAARMQQRGWKVSASIGVVSFTEPPGSIDDILARADALMYAAKRKGKGALVHEQLGPSEPARGEGPDFEALRRP